MVSLNQQGFVNMRPITATTDKQFKILTAGTSMHKGLVDTMFKVNNWSAK
jgi:hypothetical protein